MVGLTNCTIGPTCQLVGWTQQTWQAAVEAGLRKTGLCSGQHEDGKTDEISVSSNGCAGQWEQFHVYAGPESGGGRIVWANIPSQPCFGAECTTVNGGAYRGNVTIPPEFCHAPAPVPPPTQGACPVPPVTAPTSWIEPRVSSFAPGEYTVTPYWCGDPPNPGEQGLYPASACKRPDGAWAKCCKGGTEVADVGRACEVAWYGSEAAPVVTSVGPGVTVDCKDHECWSLRMSGAGVIQVRTPNVCTRWNFPEVQRNAGPCE
jgi:hypothetical protein